MKSDQSSGILRYLWNIFYKHERKYRSYFKKSHPKINLDSFFYLQIMRVLVLKQLDLLIFHPNIISNDVFSFVDQHRFNLLPNSWHVHKWFHQATRMLMITLWAVKVHFCGQTTSVCRLLVACPGLCRVATSVCFCKSCSYLVWSNSICLSWN